MLKIKIAYIVSDIDESIGFEWLAEALLASKKFEVSFYMLNPRKPKLLTALQFMGVNTIFIKCASKKDWPTSFWKLHAAFRKDKPQVVHCHLRQANILGLTAALLAGVRKRIYSRHHSTYHFEYYPKGVKWDKFVNLIATDIIAISPNVQRVLTEMEGVPPIKVHMIPHGFKLEHFVGVSHTRVDNVKRKHQIFGYPVIGVISRLEELKGLQFLIPAFQKLLLDFPSAQLVIANAKGEYMYQIIQLLQPICNSVRLITFESDLAALYQCFDLFLHVPINDHCEAFGQTYVEALAAGIPSIFTLSGIAPSFIRHNENALVADYKSATSIESCMRTLLADRSLCNAFITAGRSSIEHFDYKHHFKKLLQLYSLI